MKKGALYLAKKSEKGNHVTIRYDNAAYSQSNLRLRTSKIFAFCRKREKVWRI